MKNRYLSLIFTIIFPAFFIVSCETDNSGTNDPDPPVGNVSDCIGCHTDSDMLQATAVADTSSGSSSGEG